MNKSAQYYECTYVLNPKVGEEAAPEYEAAIRTTLENAGATIESTDAPKHQYLGYEIRESKESFIGSMRFTTEPETIEAIREALFGVKEVMRFTVCHWKKPELRTVRRVAAPEYTPKKEEATGTSEAVIDEQLEKVL